MVVDSAQLLHRKDDLVEALRVLERDREAGLVDPEAYALARDRYEGEAAAILERLDRAMPSASDAGVLARTHASRWSMILLAAASVVLAIVLLLVGALRARGAGDSITGVQPPTVAPVRPSSPAVRTAARRVAAHERSAAAWTALGQAQLNAGDTTDGVASLRTAIRLRPADPDASTSLAVTLATQGQTAQALRYLAAVERSSPAYARAWFADGLISSRRRSTLPRAIASWKRFLQVQPHSAIAPEVRTLLAAAKKAFRG